uniref:Acid phosphatase n=1 Tax=Setaria viridis TaxID=4556 RepID=A0A4U6W4K4_SETVI|nr:hypothetical protein SEVIR_2G446600v2 [Setaria viridis]
MARLAMSARGRLTMLVVFFLPLLHCVLLEGAEGAPWFWRWPPIGGGGGEDPYCLSWRVMVEANNAKGWRRVPAPCIGYVRGYMAWGQYYRDVGSVADQVAAYAAQIVPTADGLDAWVFDVDDTCLSNQPYYQAKQFGFVSIVNSGYRVIRSTLILPWRITWAIWIPCRAYDPVTFKMWASRGVCPGIPAMQWLFQTLRGRGFRVFLVTGRDEETLASSTAANLAAAGFFGYDRLIMRYVQYRFS